MCLVNDDEVPCRAEYLVVLIELTAHLLRTAKVLHGGEIDEARPLPLPRGGVLGCHRLQHFECLAVSA